MSSYTVNSDNNLPATRLDYELMCGRRLLEKETDIDDEVHAQGFGLLMFAPSLSSIQLFCRPSEVDKFRFENEPGAGLDPAAGYRQSLVVLVDRVRAFSAKIILAAKGLQDFKPQTVFDLEPATAFKSNRIRQELFRLLALDRLLYVHINDARLRANEIPQHAPDFDLLAKISRPNVERLPASVCTILMDRMSYVREIAEKVEAGAARYTPSMFDSSEWDRALGSHCDAKAVFDRMRALILETHALDVSVSLSGLTMGFLQAAIAWIALTTVRLQLLSLGLMFLTVSYKLDVSLSKEMETSGEDQSELDSSNRESATQDGKEPERVGRPDGLVKRIKYVYATFDSSRLFYSCTI